MSPASPQNESDGHDVHAGNWLRGVDVTPDRFGHLDGQETCAVKASYAQKSSGGNSTKSKDFGLLEKEDSKNEVESCQDCT